MFNFFVYQIIIFEIFLNFYFCIRTVPNTKLNIKVFFCAFFIYRLIYKNKMFLLIFVSQDISFKEIFKFSYLTGFQKVMTVF